MSGFATSQRLQLIPFVKFPESLLPSITEHNGITRVPSGVKEYQNYVQARAAYRSATEAI